MNTDYSEILLQEEERALRIEESIVDLQKRFALCEAGVTADEMVEIGEVLDDSKLLLGVIDKQATSKSIWQIACACLVLVLMAGSFVCYDLYVSGESQMAKLGNAEANVQTAGSALARAEGKVKALEAELAASKGELERVTEELAGSKNEVKAFMSALAESNVKVEGLKKQLTDTSSQLKDLQDRNDQVVKKMKERLEQL